jgi:hypothetical protein
MRASSRVVLALAACCACVALAAAQADPNWVDPNLQTEGFSAALTAEGVAGNPLGLVPVRSLQCGVLRGTARCHRLCSWRARLQQMRALHYLIAPCLPCKLAIHRFTPFPSLCRRSHKRRAWKPPMAA